jgi:hypothetical protein
MRDHRKANKTVPERIVGASAVAATITLVGGTLMVGGQPVSAATIEVNSLDDDGAGGLTTFREALALSDDGDTITFDPALFTGGPGTITALYDPFAEYDEVAIAGPGAAVLTLTNPTGDVLYLYGGGQTVSGLKIAGGFEDGVELHGQSSGLPTALTDIVIDGADNAGLKGYEIGDLVLTRVTITDNDSDGINVSGTVDGDVTVTDSLMSGNGDSGAYISDIEGALTITRSDFDNNDNEGFETREVAGAVVVEESSFSGNYDVGLYFHSDLNSDVTVTNSTIDNNGGVGLYIRNKVDGALSITNSTFSDNTGDGVLHSGYTVGDVDITDSTFDNNGGSGAELYEIQSNLSISKSSFSGNDLVGLYTGPAGYVTDAVAGDVSIRDSNFDRNAYGVWFDDGVGGSVTVARSTFSDNSVDGLVLYGSVVGDVTITDSTFSDNSGSGAAGAALYMDSVQGAVSISGSTFSNNSAPVVLKRVSGASEIVNSTFTDNDGEAVIEFDSVPAPTSQLAIRNSTISGNTPSVALVTTSDDVIQIDNSIVTDNGGAPVGEVLDDSGDPEIGSVDTTFSLVPVGAALGASNVETDAPLLGSLADNGGPTLTMLPLTDSPALDAGDPAFVAPPAKDQRGVGRVKGVAIDIGAVEVAPLFVTSLTPTRYLDTRTTGMTFDGQFQANGIRPSESILRLDVGGRGDVPADAQAVVVNVTAVRASGKGFVTAYPCDADKPLASSLNYDAGVNMANELIVTLPASGDVCLFTKTETHLLADVVGYVPAESGYGGLTPARLLDTRPTGETTDGDFEGGVKPGAGNQIELQVAGRGGVPADARVVIVNITSVAADSRGFVTVHPCLATRPVVSSLNFTAGTNRANEVIAQLDADGKLCVFNNKSTHLVVDVVGWLPAGAGYTAVSPARLVDTRATGETIDGSQEAGGIRPADSELVVPVANRANVPDSATAVVVNITAIGATQKGFITVYDCEGTRPAASSLNFVAGVNSPNELIAGLNADGEICVYTLHSIHIAVDVVGYITD